MDHTDTDRRDRVSGLWDIERATLSPTPDVDLVRRAKAEAVLARAERALSAALPDNDTSEPDPRLLPAGTPRRAPVEDRVQIEPSIASQQDGQLRSDQFVEGLRAQARQLLNTEAEVRVDVDTTTQPAIIVYEFDRPVTAAEDVQGSLYVVYEPDYKVPFQAGRRADRIVQVVQPEEAGRLPTARATLELRVEGNVATWSRADSSDQ